MFGYAISLVLRRKLRTVLTSLGITISIILLSLIIFGMQDLQRVIEGSFEEQFKPNEIFVSNSAQFGAVTGGTEEATSEGEDITRLDTTVVAEILEQPGVSEASPTTIITTFEGSIEGYDRTLNPTFISGWDIPQTDSYFKEFWGDVNLPQGDQVFVSTSFLNLYDIEDPTTILGKTISIVPTQSATIGTVRTKDTLGVQYDLEIVGVYDVGQDQNDIILSLDRSLEILAELGGFDSGAEYATEVGYDILRVKAATDEDVSSVKTYLEETYNFGSVITADDILGFLDQIIGAFTLVLIVFGIVSSVVASIGIMNTMVMSIHEQTKEIGIIKSMGASSRQILLVFLIQSGIIGLFGGILGLGIVYLGMIISDPFIVSALNSNGFTATRFFTFDLQTALIIAALSMVVGIIAGLYPAFQASRLNPVIALRSE